MALIRGRAPLESASVGLPPVRMYLDDVEEIIEYLEQHVGPVIITIGRDRADSVADLLEIGADTTRTLAVEAVDKKSSSSMLRVNVDFGLGIFSRIHSNSSEPIAHGIVHGLSGIISRHERRFMGIPLKMFLDLPWWTWCLPFILYVAVSLIVSPEVAIAANLIFWVLLLSMMIVMPLRRQNIFILRYRKDAPSFWKRKGDDILVGVVVGIALGVVGFLAGMAFERAKGENPVPTKPSPQTQTAPASRHNQGAKAVGPY